MEDPQAPRCVNFHASRESAQSRLVKRYLARIPAGSARRTVQAFGECPVFIGRHVTGQGVRGAEGSLRGGVVSDADVVLTEGGMRQPFRRGAAPRDPELSP